MNSGDCLVHKETAYTTTHKDIIIFSKRKGIRAVITSKFFTKRNMSCYLLKFYCISAVNSSLNYIIYISVCMNMIICYDV